MTSVEGDMSDRATMQTQVHSHISRMTWAVSNGAMGKRWRWCSVVGTSVVVFPAFGGRFPIGQFADAFLLH
jgi:hypothetical protein